MYIDAKEINTGVFQNQAECSFNLVCSHASKYVPFVKKNTPECPQTTTRCEQWAPQSFMLCFPADDQHPKDCILQAKQQHGIEGLSAVCKHYCKLPVNM